MRKFRAEQDWYKMLDTPVITIEMNTSVLSVGQFNRFLVIGSHLTAGNWRSSAGVEVPATNESF